MKKSIIKITAICFLATTSILKAQTTVYTIKNGAKDKDHYYYFEHSTGKVYECYLCDQKGRMPGFTIKIEGNKIYRVDEKTEKKVEIGFMTADKRILRVREGIESEANKPSADYIKDKKIYNSANNLIGIIEGNEMYGAAADVMGEFR